MCRRDCASSAAWVFQRLRPGDPAPDRTPHTELEECTMPMKRLPAIALSLALRLGLLHPFVGGKVNCEFFRG